MKKIKSVVKDITEKVIEMDTTLFNVIYEFEAIEIIETTASMAIEYNNK